MLNYEHAVCDVCVRIFNKAVSETKYRFNIQNCILCILENLTTTLKLLTADVRILNINEEKSRDVVSLKFLRIF